MSRIATPAETAGDALGGAAFDPTSAYRYWLWRNLGNGNRRCLFVMANPSTADAHGDDPTIRRCRSFALGESCGVLEVVNLFALRATKPRDLTGHPDPVGPDNDRWIRDRAFAADVVVFAWGALLRRWEPRAAAVHLIVRDISDRLPLCLGVTKDRHPRHPLFVPHEQRAYPWPGY